MVKRTEQAMDYKNAVVAVFGSHTDAEAAVKQLQTAKFDMKQLSIVGRDFHKEEHVVGYYNTGDRMLYWGKLGAFWGWICGCLFGTGFFFIPGFGPVVVAGHLVACIVAGLEGAAVIGGLDALGAGLYSMGIPKDSVLAYETAMRADKFLLIAHGTADQVKQAQGILEQTGSESVTSHQTEAVPA
jgi:hypothetical protein